MDAIWNWFHYFPPSCEIQQQHEVVRTAQPGLDLHVQFSSPCSFIQDQKDEITKKEERNEEDLGTKKNLTILFPTDKALRRQSALPSNFESPQGKGT